VSVAAAIAVVLVLAFAWLMLLGAWVVSETLNRRERGQ
jgi:hypothetical protein